MLVLHSTDWHGGGIGALANPDAVLSARDGTYKLGLSDFQKWLWDDVFLWGLRTVAEIAGGRPIVNVLTGDVVHGGRFIYSSQLINTRNQVEMAVANIGSMYELLNITDTMLTYGTSVHSTEEGLSEELIRDALSAQGRKCTLLEHALITIADTQINAAHHGPVSGKRKWIEGNDAQLYAQDMMWKCLNDLGVDPPAVILRGHVHQYAHRIGMLMIHDREYRTEIFITPPLCAANAYAQKAAQSGVVHRFGMLLLDVEGGRVVGSWPLIKSRDARTIHLSVAGTPFTHRTVSPETARENQIANNKS